MNIIFLSLLMMACAANASRLEPVESGRFKLYHQVSAQDFVASLADYERFTEAFVSMNSDSDFFPCEGWPSFAQIFPTHVSTCILAKKMGMSANLVSNLSAVRRQLENCAAVVSYRVDVLPQTTPQLVRENVAGVDVRFCLQHDGFNVHYDAFVHDGSSRGFLYSIIVREFKKIIPTLVKSVIILNR